MEPAVPFTPVAFKRTVTAVRLIGIGKVSRYRLAMSAASASYGPSGASAKTLYAVPPVAASAARRALEPGTPLPTR